LLETNSFSRLCPLCHFCKAVRPFNSYPAEIRMAEWL